MHVKELPKVYVCSYHVRLVLYSISPIEDFPNWPLKRRRDLLIQEEESWISYFAVPLS